MEYAALTEDFGQGNDFILVPVARVNHKAEVPLERPRTAEEIIREHFCEDYGLVLGNYVRMETPEIQRATNLADIKQVRVISYHYKRTESVLHQPLSATAIDLILAVVVQGNVINHAKHEAFSTSWRTKTASVKIQTDENGELQFRAVMDMRIRYILDLRPCSQICLGPLIYIDGAPGAACPAFSDLPIVTNEYLLPILRAEDYPKVAQDMIRRYFPEEFREGYLRPGFTVDGAELARRMRVHVEYVRFADTRCMGRAYFEHDTVELLTPDGHCYNSEVKPFTILIDRQVCNKAHCLNSTLVHECSHIYLDHTFFMLQFLTGNPFQNHTKRVKTPAKYEYPNSSPIQWMELQAEKLPAFIIMEESSTRCFVEALLADENGERSIRAMQSVLNQMAEHYHVSKSMAKYRLIEMGYSEAEGIYNFVDHSYIPDHACAGKWPKGCTFTITPIDLANLCVSDQRVDRLLRNGTYRYVEGHLCFNHPNFISIKWVKGREFASLTSYARSHIDECCVVFRPRGRYSRASYDPASCSRKAKEPYTDRFLGRYEFASEPDTQAYERENLLYSEDSKRWGKLKYSIPEDFCDAVDCILKEKNMSRESLALSLNIDRKTLYSAMRASRPSLSHMVGIFVALGVPYYISIDVIEANGPNMRNIDLHSLYRQMLLSAGSITIERCNDILKKSGFPPFFGNETSPNSKNLPS